MINVIRGPLTLSSNYKEAPKTHTPSKHPAPKTHTPSNTPKVDPHCSPDSYLLIAQTLTLNFKQIVEISFKRNFSLPFKGYVHT